MSTVAPALSPAERRQRNVAVLVLAIAVALAIGLLHVLWWKPWSAARAQANQLAERQARAQALVAQRGQIETALSAAEDAARQQPLWLPEGSVAQAIDGIAQRVDQSVAMVGGEGQRCRVQSRNPTPVANKQPPDRDWRTASPAGAGDARAPLTRRRRATRRRWRVAAGPAAAPAPARGNQRHVGCSTCRPTCHGCGDARRTAPARCPGAH